MKQWNFSFFALFPKHEYENENFALYSIAVQRRDEVYFSLTNTLKLLIDKIIVKIMKTHLMFVVRKIQDDLFFCNSLLYGFKFKYKIIVRMKMFDKSYSINYKLINPPSLFQEWLVNHSCLLSLKIVKKCLRIKLLGSFCLHCSVHQCFRNNFIAWFFSPFASLSILFSCSIHFIVLI